ncbi:hypothetical protein CC85DRAFT_326752 [Cutaneotrichosporon oleaginosum]|uniref:Uncharacterized protein n=1 Tax=Cutaneotrichosporon oleaginosum TaxID=879819 RepID=A0A0J0XSP0_9TREE|nr:uncharacterized protein CC85DRAFT_326752 [Cutaneotrichosporon oleaginosum]KLT44087.1 hypothetical protein CC85DRAFT_326752 [Cutaneotrichosporon oleaginosum]TXT09458.1 hypothetical protein COLE_03392 [Cutaneotrichosporon oleaginosum]
MAMWRLPLPPRVRPLRISQRVRVVGLAAVLAVTLVASVHVLSAAGTTTTASSARVASQPAFLAGFGEECRGWIPTDPTTDHLCPGASERLREVQTFLQEPVLDYGEEVYTAARRLEACALGLVECPERPLVVSLWPASEQQPTFFAEVERRAELAWHDDIHEGVELFNYVFVPTADRAKTLHLVKALRASIHQVWMGEIAAIECMQNPRCIADDYVAASVPAMVPNITEVPDTEKGPVDLWRLMVTSWHGVRPSRAQSPGHDLTRDWGVATQGGEEHWSIHPIGRWHTISPYPFPDHAWVPFTHARACDPSTFTITRKPKRLGTQIAERTVLILGDATDLENAEVDWAGVWRFLHDRGLNATFTIPSSTPLSHKWLTAFPADPEAYPELLGEADALLGIGTPHLATTPYIAMCRGTPAVFPTFRNIGSLGFPMGWERYDPSWMQHGQYYVDEPEPQGFKYPAGDMELLAYELWKALSSERSPHTPRQFGPLGLYESLEAMLHFDYEGEYNQQRSVRGGPIGLAEDLRVNCWKQGWCRKDGQLGGTR